MAKNESGHVYIMTNKAMPGLVKIGYAKDVEARRKSFSNQTCIPYEFEVYKAFPTTVYAADKTVHTWFSPELRVNMSREFFNITPEYASSVIEKKIAEAKHISSTFLFGESETTECSGGNSVSAIEKKRAYGRNRYHQIKNGTWANRKTSRGKSRSEMTPEELAEVREKARKYRWARAARGSFPPSKVPKNIALVQSNAARSLVENHH